MSDFLFIANTFTVTQILNVEGMSCSHCENAVKTAVGELDGVKSVIVDLNSKKVTEVFDHDKVTFEDIKEAIVNQGYYVV